MATLGDSVSAVMFKLGNRTDLAESVGGAPSRIDLWLAKAYTNLAMAFPFSELEDTQTFVLVQGQDTYPYPSTVRAIKNLTLYEADGTVLTVQTKDIKYIRQMNAINQAAPSMQCDFGNSIIFRPVPDGNGPYTCTLDVWLLPLVDYTSQASLEATEVLLPLDWVEALEYGAAVRGHAELQEEDKARSLQNLLYGSTDPSTGKYTPGLIQNLQNRMQATAPYVDWGIQPKGQTQTYGRR